MQNRFNLSCGDRPQYARFNISLYVGGRLLRRLQQQRLDSQLTDVDMIMEHGEVLVSIGQGQIGKVRILVDGVYAE